MTNYLADTSYLAVIPETNEGEALKPTHFIPLVSESVRSDLAHEADRRIKGNSWKSDDLLRGSRKHEGDIVVFADPDSLGHLLNMVFKKGVTTGDATDGYIHPFTVGAVKSYTIEIGKGNYAQRFFGVKGENLKLEFVDGKLQATLSVKAMKQVSVVTLAAALTGVGMTTVTLKQDYDLKPNEGFVIGDIITVGGIDITLTGVETDGITLTFIATDVTASIGDSVVLKLQTPSYTDLVEPFFQGNALVGVGADETASTTAAGAKATATAMYEFVINKLNNLLNAPASGSMDPIKLLPRTQEASLAISQLFETEAQHQDWLDRIKQAITMIISGKIIGAGLEGLTWKFYKVKLLTNEEALNVGEYIFDKQEFEVLYDSDVAKATDLSLTNRSAGTIYGD